METEDKLPEMNEVLKNPIILVTLNYDKINGERQKNVSDINSEIKFLADSWKEGYTDNIDWNYLNGIKFANSYIESLMRLINMQFRMIETGSDTINKMKEVVEKYYIVKESLMNLTEENKKNKEVILQIEDEENKRFFVFTEKVKTLTLDPKDYSGTVIKQHILNPIENKLKDRSLTKLIIRRIMVGGLSVMKSSELEHDTKQKVMKLFAETFKMYYEVFNEYPFLPKDKEELEKEWDIVLMPVST